MNIPEDDAAAYDKDTNAKTNKTEEKEMGSVKTEAIAKTLAKEPNEASEIVNGNRTLKQGTVKVEVNNEEGEDEEVNDSDTELNAIDDELNVNKVKIKNGEGKERICHFQDQSS